MGSPNEMRQPYGPGWEATDWTPHGPVPDTGAAPQLRPAGARLVRSLGEFMDVVRSVAVPRRARLPQPAPAISPFVGQTRRWVMAGGAGLLAISMLSGARTAGTPRSTVAASERGNAMDPESGSVA